MDGVVVLMPAFPRMHDQSCYGTSAGESAIDRGRCTIEMGNKPAIRKAFARSEEMQVTLPDAHSGKNAPRLRVPHQRVGACPRTIRHEYADWAAAGFHHRLDFGIHSELIVLMSEQKDRHGRGHKLYPANRRQNGDGSGQRPEL